MFVGVRLHVTGGVLRGGRSIEGEGAIAGMYLFFFFFAYLHFGLYSGMYCYDWGPKGYWKWVSHNFTQVLLS